MLFAPLPDSSRLWLRALAAAPSPEPLARLRSGLAGIMAQWRHKGIAYAGLAALLDDRIIAVAEPTLAAAPSGCAIDGMLRRIDRLAGELALPLLDPAQTVLVRLPQGLRAIPKADLAQALDQGQIDADTPVLDLSLYSLGELRAGHLESPLATTWIARKYNLPTAG